MKRAISILGLLLLAVSLRAQISDEPLVRFGVVADVQYDRDTTVGVNGRHYSIEKDRLAEAIETFNSWDDLSFTVSLGDIVDRDFVTAFPDLKPVLALSKIPIHYVYGNHDYVRPFSAKKQKEFYDMVGRDDSYYSFISGGVKFIIMNDNEIALFSSEVGSVAREQAKAFIEDAKAKGLKHAKSYNGAVSKKQLKWLDKELKDASKKKQLAIILAHQPLTPEGNKHLLLNYQDVLKVIAKYPGTAVAYLAGHDHKGGKDVVGDTAFITFKGMCEGENNRYGIVSIYPDRLELQGFGDQKSMKFNFNIQ